MASFLSFILLTILMLGVNSGARELRPSYHGLEYQSTPPVGEKSPPEMKEFFRSSSPPTSSKSSSGVALPNAMNSNDTTWWAGVGGKHGGGGGDRLKHVLFVASIACGVTGSALLLASAFIYFVKQKKKTTSLVDNSKAIVVRK